MPRVASSSIARQRMGGFGGLFWRPGKKMAKVPKNGEFQGRFIWINHKKCGFDMI